MKKKLFTIMSALMIILALFAMTACGIGKQNSLSGEYTIEEWDELMRPVDETIIEELAKNDDYSEKEILTIRTEEAKKLGFKGGEEITVSGLVYAIIDDYAHDRIYIQIASNPDSGRFDLGVFGSFEDCLWAVEQLEMGQPITVKFKVSLESFPEYRIKAFIFDHAKILSPSRQ